MFTCSIASLPVAFDCTDAAFARELKGFYAPFLSRDKPFARVRVEVSQSAIPGSPFSLETSPSPENVFACHGRGIRLVFDLRRHSGTLTLFPGQKLFDVALRVIYSLLLPFRGGALVHGAGISDGGRGYLFFGPSGAGKTTLAGLSAAAGKWVLTDELAALRRVDGRHYLYGTPFWGNHKGTARPRGIPLTATVEPVKSSRLFWEPSPGAGHAGRFLGTVLNFSRQREANEALLDVALNLAGAVPHYRMEFKKEDPIWEAFRRAA